MFRLAPETEVSPPIDLAEVLSRPVQRSLNLDHQMYLIIKRHRLGAYSMERDVANMGRAKTIEDVASDPADLAAIIEFNAVEHTSRDATSDIMAEIASRAADSGQPISQALWDLISDTCGIDYAIGLKIADRTFAAA